MFWPRFHSTKNPWNIKHQKRGLRILYKQKTTGGINELIVCGNNILTHIKKIDADLPVIMISGHANVQMAVDSLKLGAFEFMQKPFSSERLLNFVNIQVSLFL